MGAYSRGGLLKQMTLAWGLFEGGLTRGFTVGVYSKGGLFESGGLIEVLRYHISNSISTPGGYLILKTIGVCHSQLLALGLGENARRAKIDTLGENMEVKLWKSIP